MKQLKSIIAVDPGSAGGIAIRTCGKVSAEAYRSDDQILSLVRPLIDEDTCSGDVVAYMEQVGGFMGDKDKSPGAAMFNFGDGYGYYRGMFGALDIPLVLVPPQKWMRATLPGVIGMEKPQRKRALKEFAQSLHPELAVTLLTADALVILRYAEQCESGRAGAPPVAIPHRTHYARDAKEAKKWCKSQGFPVPKGAELIKLVNYWRSTIRGQ